MSIIQSNITFERVTQGSTNLNNTLIQQELSDAIKDGDFTQEDYYNNPDFTQENGLPNTPLVNAVDIDWNGAVLKIA